MQRSIHAFVIAALSVIAGCVPTLHSILTEADLMDEPALVGTWSENDDEVWVFSKSDAKQYKLVYTERGKAGPFTVHLGKIDGQMFMDLYPDEVEVAGNDFYKMHLLPVHTFLHVQQVRPTLKMRIMNPNWIKDYLRDHPDAVRHETNEDGDALLTAPPAELQAFVLKHVNTPDAFGDWIELKRR